jgi:hypothetical protein
MSTAIGSTHGRSEMNGFVEPWEKMPKLPRPATPSQVALKVDIRNVVEQADVDLNIHLRRPVRTRTASGEKARWGWTSWDWRTRGYHAVETTAKHAAAALQEGAPVAAKRLWRRAQATYEEQLEGQRKLVYFLGVLFGIAGCAVVQRILHDNLASWFGKTLTESRADQLIVFASMGTLASVLTRLNRFRLHNYATRNLVFISGASRPLVSVFMTFGVYAAFQSGLLGITINGKSASNFGATGYWTLAFLTGFSERFGTNILQGVADRFGSGSAHQDPDMPEPATDALTQASNGREPTLPQYGDASTSTNTAATPAEADGAQHADAG